MDVDEDFLFADELPADARRLIDDAERAVDDVRKRRNKAVAAVRDALERECQALRAQADLDIAQHEATAANELTPILRSLYSRLKILQTSYVAAGQLDEALAIRSRLRGIRSDLLGVKPDPGNLTEFNSTDIGQSMIYEVTGSLEGNVWGTDEYTGDSHLASAVVHAGVLRVGGRGLVRVTLIDGSEHFFEGSERHGIRSMDHNNYSVGYTLERV